MTAAAQARAGERHSPPLPGVFARGLAMGVAEIVPGVSGGTIAFITGVYDELVRALGSFTAVSSRTLLQGGWRELARRHHLAFLATLGAGMVASFLVVARFLEPLLETHAAQLYGFFLGLIAASVLQVGRTALAAAPERGWSTLPVLALAGLGIGLIVALLSEPASQADAGLPVFFLAGAAAAVAWILPGVSGAFVLLLFGLYKPMVAAVNAGDLPLLLVFGAGLGLGVVSFSRLLAWLLGRVRGPLLALLTGLMAGSLLLLWRRTGAQGWSHPDLPWVLCAAAAGAVLVAGLAWLASRRDHGGVDSLRREGEG